MTSDLARIAYRRPTIDTLDVVRDALLVDRIIPETEAELRATLPLDIALTAHGRETVEDLMRLHAYAWAREQCGKGVIELSLHYDSPSDVQISPGPVTSDAAIPQPSYPIIFAGIPGHSVIVQGGPSQDTCESVYEGYERQGLRTELDLLTVGISFPECQGRGAHVSHAALGMDGHCFLTFALNAPLVVSRQVRPIFGPGALRISR